MTETKSQEEIYSVYFVFGDSLPQVDKVSTEAVKLDYDYSVWDVLTVAAVVYLIGGGTVLFVSVRTMRKPPRTLLQML